MPHVRQLIQGSLGTTISFYRDEKRAQRHDYAWAYHAKNSKLLCAFEALRNVDLFYGP